MRPSRLAAPLVLAALPIAPSAAAPPVLAIWARSATSTPISSEFSVSAWGSPAALPPFSSNTRWIVARTCPTRDELAAAALDNSKDIRLAFFRNGAWENPTTLCTKAATSKDRCFDAVYERSSGDLLAVYWNSDTDSLGYRTSSGTAISGEASLSLNPAGTDDNDDQKVRYVTLSPDPLSDRMILLAMQDDKDLLAVQWNGSSWNTPTTLETDCESDSNENYAAAYEALSGRALIAYSQRNLSQPRYRLFTDAGFSSEMAAPSVGSRAARWIRLASRPGTDDILMVCLDRDKDINATLWSGSSSTWGPVTELSDDARYDNRRCFDVAFESTGNRALAVYSHKNKDELYFRTWTATGGWSAEQKGPDLGDDPDVILLQPALTGATIFVLASTRSKDLYATRWTGSALTSATLLENSLATDSGTEQFGFTDHPAAAPIPLITRWEEVNPQ